MIITRQEVVPDFSATRDDFVLEVTRDENADNPRSWDNVGTIVSWNAHTRFGDKTINEQYQFELVLLGILNDSMNLSDSQYENIMEFANADVLYAAIKKHTKAALLPVYLYDHSGISISTCSRKFSMFDPARWDWGISGIIYCTESKIKKEYDVSEVTDETRKKAEDALRQEIKTLDMYFSGDVYEYTLQQGEEILDSCSGIYGEGLDELKKELKGVLSAEYHDLIENLKACEYP